MEGIRGIVDVSGSYGKDIAQAINMRNQNQEGYDKLEGADYWRVHWTFHQTYITKKYKNVIVIK